MTAVEPIAPVEGGLADLAAAFVGWLEDGVRHDDLFAPALFVDLTMPHWRVQAEGPDAAYRLREDSHPFSGEVRVEALDRTSRGFLLQFEERWVAEGQRW